MLILLNITVATIKCNQLLNKDMKSIIGFILKGAGSKLQAYVAQSKYDLYGQPGFSPLSIVFSVLYLREHKGCFPWA